jgi:hypothetical protein
MKSLDGVNFKLTNSVNDPREVNFDIMGLHKKRTIVKGELLNTEYFKNYDGVTYSDKVLEEIRTYNRDSLDIVITRDITINYYLENDTIGLSKTWTKFYGPEEAISEGIIRRDNIVSLAKVVLLDELYLVFGTPTNQMYAFDLLLELKTEIEYFKEGYTAPLRDKIIASTKPYMTQPIKDAVSAALAS